MVFTFIYQKSLNPPKYKFCNLYLQPAILLHSVQEGQDWNLSQYQSGRRRLREGLWEGKGQHFKTGSGNKVLLQQLPPSTLCTSFACCCQRHDMHSALINGTLPGCRVIQERFSQTGSWNHHQLILKGLRTSGTLRGPLILCQQDRSSHSWHVELQGWSTAPTAAMKRGQFYTRETEMPQKVQHIIRTLGCSCLTFV